MSDTTLDRFLSAQAEDYDTARTEILAGRKQTHWVWYIYPQLRGLGSSDRAHLYGIADLDEARRYLAHPILGNRLVEMAETLMMHAGKEPEDILGNIDALKVRSCMTLFEKVPDAPPVFTQVLDTFYNGERCPKTLQML
ncbi:DUF1810 domain-containing protein [Histidinibacterium aquaticum]|uniref:DUF1810 domain-containing protein n=1 Tax=Histidinibacterium aquaticum TaxID=2613962 RepID=A0A5J5GEZ7_9RHOB|nr:DUF1810 domain-containing protein [Histidinibacterium aquaticum]KAA9006671.1 DUF1810 domain-containing protein [Histidinibacterium aquaticum]